MGGVMPSRFDGLEPRRLVTGTQAVSDTQIAPSPACGLRSDGIDSQSCESLQVCRGCQEREILSDAFAPSCPSTAASVTPTGEVSKFAFNLGAGCFVFASPLGIRSLLAPLFL